MKFGLLVMIVMAAYLIRLLMLKRKPEEPPVKAVRKMPDKVAPKSVPPKPVAKTTHTKHHK